MYGFNYTKLTQRLREARTTANYTQEQIANALNCTPAYISNIENNRTKPNLRILSYYSRICNVPLAHFLEVITEDTSSIQPQSVLENTILQEEEQINNELLEILRSFTVSEKKKLIHMLKIWKSE